MDIITFSTQLEESMKAQLEEVRTTHREVIAGPAKRLVILEETLAKLKQFVRRYRFTGQQEEVQFFKEVKPLFLSQYFFYKKLFSIRLQENYMSPEEKQVFHKEVLAGMARFVDQHVDFLVYCMTDQTHLDAHYFTRQQPGAPTLADPSCSTGYDEILAEYLADDRLKDIWLPAEGLHGVVRSNLKWTGRKTDLIELLFALQASGCINHADAQVKEIASALERLFNISLGNYYSVLGKIRLRKNPDLFLDQLKEDFLRKVQELDQS